MPEKQKSEIQELSEFIRDHMVTKSDIADMATKDDVRMIVRTFRSVFPAASIWDAP